MHGYGAKENAEIIVLTGGNVEKSKFSKSKLHNSVRKKDTVDKVIDRVIKLARMKDEETNKDIIEDGHVAKKTKTNVLPEQSEYEKIRSKNIEEKEK